MDFSIVKNQAGVVEDRAWIKEQTAQIDALVSKEGFLCGLPLAMFMEDRSLVHFSCSFLKSLIVGLGGTIPERPQTKPKEEDLPPKL